MSFKIGKGITLRKHIQDCTQEKVSSEWMICESTDYTLDMMVYPVFLDNWDLEPEEYEEIENTVLLQGSGYGNLLNEEQLVDIVRNLAKQKADYNEANLEAAINYYSERDAFIEI